jgi:TRAP-type uncharacterized transport system substrate-binding protein
MLDINKIIEFIETTNDIKLYDYQKRMVKAISEQYITLEKKTINIHDIEVVNNDDNTISIKAKYKLKNDGGLDEEAIVEIFKIDLSKFDLIKQNE